MAQTTGEAGTVDGGAPPADRAPRLEELLRAIAADYDRASTDDERRRLGREQLMEITLHLQREGVPGEALRPAAAVIHGLIDVDRGCVPPILRTRRKAGGPPVPSDELRQRGLAAAAVTLLMRADDAAGHDEHKLDRAVRKVARRVERWRAARRWTAKSRGQPLHEAVKDWRERAMRGLPAEGADAGIYAAMLEHTRDARSPAEAADWALTKGHELYR